MDTKTSVLTPTSVPSALAAMLGGIGKHQLVELVEDNFHTFGNMDNMRQCTM